MSIYIRSVPPRRSALAAVVTAAVLALALLLASGCTGGPPAAVGAPQKQGMPSAGAVVVGAAAPNQVFTVGVRRLSLRRAGNRPLPTFVWYPAAGAAAGTGKPVADAPPAPGRFPLVLFSHGLGGMPNDYQPLMMRWVAAGFVVAAPQFPRTNRHVGQVDRNDVPNQPADAAFVLAEVGRLDTQRRDPLAGHLDTTRLAATGYSAGGFTTSGMFVAGREPRLRSAVVIAAGAIDAHAFTGAAAPVLFVHGDADRTVTYDRGRSAYDRVGWPKAFLTMYHQGHGEYLTPGRSGYEQTARTTTDFLRWTVLGDTAARDRLAADGNLPGVCRLDNRL